MPVIDCHHHVWWLDKFPHQFPPSWGTSLNRDFTPDDLKPELAACGIDGTVLVQSLDKYEENLHYLDVAEQNAFIRGVVGWVPLADPAACARALDAMKSRKKFVGMRHLIVYEKDPRWLLQPAVQESLGEFRKRGYAFEAITNTEEQMDTVLDTARRMPDLNIVLNHLGRPPLPEKGWEPWASQMVRAAAFPNISREAVGRRRHRVALEVVDGRNPPLLRPRHAAFRSAPRHGGQQLAGGPAQWQLPGSLARHRGLARGPVGRGPRRGPGRHGGAHLQALTAMHRSGRALLSQPGAGCYDQFEVGGGLRIPLPLHDRSPPSRVPHEESAMPTFISIRKLLGIAAGAALALGAGDLRAAEHTLMPSPRRSTSAISSTA